MTEISKADEVRDRLTDRLAIAERRLARAEAQLAQQVEKAATLSKAAVAERARTEKVLADLDAFVGQIDELRALGLVQAEDDGHGRPARFTLSKSGRGLLEEERNRRRAAKARAADAARREAELEDEIEAETTEG